MKRFNEIARRVFHYGKAIAVVLPILAVVTITAIAHAETIVGKISSVNGAVEIVRGTETLAATKGMSIRLHDKVVTGADGSVTILMSDNSLLHLGQSGTLLISRSTMSNGFTASGRSDSSSAQEFLGHIAAKRNA